VLGWKAGVFTAVVDLLKGAFAAVYISRLRIGDYPETILGSDAALVLALVAAVFAVIGHMFPLYAGFKGGKGVATAAGGLMALTPFSLILALVTFVVVLFATRYVSLSSILAAIIFPGSLAIRKYFVGVDSIDNALIIISSLMALGIVVAHRSNISRLFLGTENRIKSFRPAQGSKNSGS